MKQKPNRGLTRKQILGYLDQLLFQIETNKKDIYDLSRTLKDYMEMQGQFENFAEYRQKVLGLDAQIPTRWSVFRKFFKNKYLQLKKILDFGK